MSLTKIGNWYGENYGFPWFGLTRIVLEMGNAIPDKDSYTLWQFHFTPWLSVSFHIPAAITKLINREQCEEKLGDEQCVLNKGHRLGKGHTADKNIYWA